MFDSINNKPDKQILRALLFEALSSQIAKTVENDGKLDSKLRDFPEKSLVSWYDPLQIQTTSEGIQVVFPHQFFATWFSDKGKALFEHIIALHFGENTKIEYINAGSSFGRSKAAVRHKSSHLPINSKNIRIHQHQSDHYHFSHKRHSTNSFLYSSKNQMIDHVLRWSAKDGLLYNPILILGPSATGKTHLLQKIATKLAADPELPVLFLSAGELQQAFESWKKAGLSFNRLARESSAFCLDDVHLLAGDQATQQDLILLFNLIMTYNKSVVCTALASNPVSQSIIKTSLISPLFSRLGMGLIINLREPELDLLFSFAQEQLAEKMIPANRDFCLQIARKCSNFRILQGAILRISAFHSHTGQLPEGVDLDNIFSSSGDPNSLTSEQIITVVSTKFGYNTKDLRGKKRDSKLVQARQVAMYLCRELLGESYPVLGKIFGDKDHSTVIHGVKKIRKTMDENKDMHNLVTELTNICRQHLI